MVFWWTVLLFCGGMLPEPQPVLLSNPSFEDEPWPGKPPRGWFFCGRAGESPPDVHPGDFFGVNLTPAQGNTYAGLVVRDNGTWEALGQRLEQPLGAGRCYLFSLKAARSTGYRSVSRLTGEPADYSGPVRVRIWGGRAHCERAELLGASLPVADTNWTELTFHLKPREVVQFLIIEAFYPSDAVSNYRGNVLIDDCSPLLPADCGNFQPLASCPSLSLTAPRDRRELEQLVAGAAAEISYSGESQELRNNYFMNETGTPVQENAGIYRIVRALAHFPELHLTIAVAGASRELARQRIALMEQQLYRLGFPPGRLGIRMFRKGDERLPWLGINPEKDIYLGLR